MRVFMLLADEGRDRGDGTLDLVRAAADRRVEVDPEHPEVRIQLWVGLDAGPVDAPTCDVEIEFRGPDGGLIGEPGRWKVDFAPGPRAYLPREFEGRLPPGRYEVRARVDGELAAWCGLEVVAR